MGAYWVISKLLLGKGLYFQVDDIEKSLLKAKQLGGEVEQEKVQISEEIGYQGKFKDVFGNIIGVFSDT